MTIASFFIVLFRTEIAALTLEKIIKDIKQGKNNSKQKDDIVLKEYFTHIEKKASYYFGRKVKLSNKTLSISFVDNKDLEEFLKKICGNDFFSEE